MVERQIAALEFIMAVLASVFIPQVDVFAAKSDFVGIVVFNITFQSEDARHLESGVRAPCENCMIFENFNFVLEPKNKSPAPVDDLHGFITSIEE